MIGYCASRRRHAGLWTAMVMLAAATVVQAGALAIVALTPTPAEAAGPPPGSPNAVSFTTPGSTSWVVPSGVTEVAITAYGAQGGGIPGADLGGGGGEVAAQVTVVPGETLVIDVGGSDGTNGGGPTEMGGWNGGGSTDVREGGSGIANRILVAGGGGGEGDSWVNPNYSPGGAGGAAGGDAGDDV